MFTTVGTQSSETNLSTAESFADTGQPNAAPWDTSDPNFSAQTRDTLITVFRCYVQQMIAFIGIPGNVLCGVVFLKQGLSDRINLLLCSLAVADLTHLTAQLLFSPGCYMPASERTRALNWEVLVTAKIIYVHMWSGFVSGTLIVVMSVDRCLSVVIPLKAGRILTYRSMLAAILLMYLIPLSCFFPSFLAFTVKWRTDPATNSSAAYMAVSDWFTLDPKVASEILSNLTFFVKPLSVAIVVVCCIITIVKLRQASRRRLQMTGMGKEDGGGGGGDNRITKMLLFLCVVYVVLVLPEVSNTITFVIVPEYYLYRKYHNTFAVMYGALLNTFSCTNSTVNFFAYLLLSSKFRKTIKEFGHLRC